MFRWIEQYLTITRKSFTVFLGDPLVILVNLSFIAITSLVAGLPGFTFGEQIQMLRDQVLAMAFSGGCLVAAFGAGMLVSDDMQNGMIPLIMSRPVRPSAFIFGRWTGITGVLGVLLFTACVCCLWATRMIYFEEEIEILSVVIYWCILLACLLFMAVRHYFFRGAFVWQANIAIALSMAVAFLILNFWGYNGKLPSDYGALVDWKSAYAYISIFMALCVFAAILCFLSVFLQQSALLITGLIIFFAGLFIRYFIDMIPEENTRYLLMVFLPDWQTYWISDKIRFIGSSFPVKLLCSTFFQTLSQSLIYLSLALAVFRRKEISGSL